MLGAIFGDIVGSRFEFHNCRSKEFELFHEDCGFTDDSLMTLAVADALTKAGDSGEEALARQAVRSMRALGQKYPHNSWGASFGAWLQADDPKPYGSWGNGAAMRVSPVGWYARSEEEVKRLSRAVTAVTHDHPEGLKGAECTAMCVFLARIGATEIINQTTGAVEGYKLGDAIIYDQAASYHAWMIFVIALVVITAIGALIEYYFTRERVTEETLSSKVSLEKKVGPTFKEQAKICFKDKFWWLIIVFFFLYQLGGMMKNVSQLYYCAANFADNGAYGLDVGGTFSGTIGIVGAIPTALGMVLAWPLSNKIGKGKAILLGAIVSVLGGVLGFFADGNFALAVTAFVIKALGSTPAMYLSLALLADILDHQEAMHGKRTDGFTMMIYGAVMAGMTGIATGIMNGVLAGFDVGAVGFSYHDVALPMTFIFFGGETICYFVIILLFLFMKVEKFSKFDHKAITMDQKAKAAAEGVEYVDPAEKLKQEEAEAELASEEARKAELKARCEKKGLSYEEEEAKYEAKRAEAQAKQAEKQAAAEAKKAAAEAEKAEKYAALSDEQKAELARKEAAAEKAAKEREARVLAEFNAIRERNGKPALE